MANTNPDQTYIKVVYRSTLVSYVPFDGDHYPGMTLEEAINYETLKEDHEKAEFLGEALQHTNVKIDVGAYAVQGKPEQNVL